MNSRLHDDMSDLASEAKSPDLYDRVLATSRRQLIRRNSIAGLAAVVAISGGVIGVGAIAGPADPGPAPTAFEGDGEDLRGRLFDAFVSPNLNVYTLLSRTHGSEPTEVAKLTGVVTQSPRLSPDGSQLSWLSLDEDEPGAPHTLMIRDLASGEDTEITGGIPAAATGCVNPTWTLDGSRLFVDRGDDASDGRYGFIDIATEEFTPLPGFRGCDPRMAMVSDREVVYSIDETEVYVSGLGDDATATPIADALAAEGLRADYLTAVSNDGELACVDTDEIDAPDGRTGSWDCDLIVEIETGTVVDLADLGDWSANETVFNHPAGLILHLREKGDDGYTIDTLTLTGRDGSILAEADWFLPSDEFESLFVGYRS